jgi:hypothetical protein
MSILAIKAPEAARQGLQFAPRRARSPPLEDHKGGSCPRPGPIRSRTPQPDSASTERPIRSPQTRERRIATPPARRTAPLPGSGVSVFAQPERPQSQLGRNEQERFESPRFSDARPPAGSRAQHRDSPFSRGGGFPPGSKRPRMEMLGPSRSAWSLDRRPSGRTLPIHDRRDYRHRRPSGASRATPAARAMPAIAVASSSIRCACRPQSLSSIRP